MHTPSNISGTDSPRQVANMTKTNTPPGAPQFRAALPDGILLHDVAPGLAVLTLAGQRLTQGDALQLPRSTFADDTFRPLGRINAGRRLDDGDERFEALAITPNGHLVRVVLYRDDGHWSAATHFLQQLNGGPTILLSDWRQP